MAVEQPIGSDALNNPDHSVAHRVIAVDNSAPAKSVSVDSAGNIRRGDVDSGNYGNIDTTGRSRLKGTSVEWDDLRVVPGAFQFVGAGDPTISDWQPAGTGTTFKVYKFVNDDEAFFTCQLPHTYKEGTNLRPHIHWTPCDRGNEESGNTVAWKLDYSFGSIHGVFPTASGIDMTQACTGIDDYHELAGTVAGAEIDGSGGGISSMLVCRLYRDSDAEDTWAGVTAAQSPALLEFDIHFQIDSLGSEAELSKA